ncbi:MAG: transporter [Bacteroidia bacterium]|nr:transporter [Bacteroidia bacterium]
MNIIKFIKNWTLPIAMITGVVSYFIYAAIPLSDSCRVYVEEGVAFIQPALIFAMLFLTFCKIDFSQLKPCKWHLWLLLIQCGSFLLMGVALYFLIEHPTHILIEAAMLCMICPTATAAAVVTHRLGGNAAHLTSYTVLINLAVAILVPLVVSIVFHNPGLTFISSFTLILGKVFPLLLCPILAAILLQIFLPSVRKKLGNIAHISFYIWAVALTLAIAVTVKSIVHSNVSVWYQIGIAIISAITCIIQFVCGKKIGKKYNDTITAGQSLGQKNTVLVIWMGYTFFTPISAVAGGFYSIWHNIYNSYQLYQQRIPRY